MVRGRGLIIMKMEILAGALLLTLPLAAQDAAVAEKAPQENVAKEIEALMT